jgi:prefoldin subunit 5
MDITEIIESFNETIAVINETKEKYMSELEVMTSKLHEIESMAEAQEAAVKKKLEAEKQMKSK